MKKATYTFLTTNLVGLLVFWCSDHRIRQFARSEQRENFDFGDSLSFLFTAIPTYLVCIFFCGVWLVISVLAAIRRQSMQELVVFCAVGSAWIGMLFVTEHQNLITDISSLASLYLHLL
jgi:hypothetical protein